MESENWKEIFSSIWEGEGGKSFIQSLLDAGLDINSWKNRGRTALSYAAELGDVEFVEFLVGKGADGDVKDSDGSKPLHIAAKLGHLNIVEFFHNQGVSVDSCGNNNYTPLHYAAENGHIEVAKFLVRNNADMNVKNSYSSTPLVIAASKKRRDLVEFLINSGADVRHFNRDQDIVLSYACELGWVEVVRRFIEIGCNINGIEYSYWPPLHIACFYGKVEIIRLLLKSGADWRIRNKNYLDETAFNCMFKGEPNVEAIRLLVEYGAYFEEHPDYVRVYCNSLLRRLILKDIKLCTQAIMNKFNNKDLPSFYKLPGCAERLPPIERLKIAPGQSVAREIEKSVQCDIQANSRGHCNLIKVEPMVLKIMCVKSLITYCCKNKIRFF